MKVPKWLFFVLNMIKNMSYFKNLLFFFVLASMASCVESTDLGQELLQEDFIGTGFIEDFEIHSRTVKVIR